MERFRHRLGRDVERLQEKRLDEQRDGERGDRHGDPLDHRSQPGFEAGSLAGCCGAPRIPKLVARVRGVVGKLMTDRHVDVGAVITVDDCRLPLGGAVLVVSHASTLSVRRCSLGSEPIAGEYPRGRLAGHVGFERRIDRHDLSLGSKAEQEAFEPGDRRDCQRDDEVVALGGR